MNVDVLLARLEKVRPAGSNKWRACCPSHNGDNPTALSIAQMNDGRVLIHCFAGCPTLDVLGSVGLKMQDLFPEGCLGEFKGFFQLQEDVRRGREKRLDQKLSKEHTILEIAKQDRNAGKRLSPSDLKREQEAYWRIRNANNNG